MCFSFWGGSVLRLFICSFLGAYRRSAGLRRSRIEGFDSHQHTEDQGVIGGGGRGGLPSFETVNDVRV